MRFLLCLALLCLAESTHHWKRDPWGGGSVNKEYVYKYKGIVYSGLPAISEQYAAFVVKADLKVIPADTETVYLKMKNVMVGKSPKVELTNLDIEDPPVPLAPSTFYEDLSIPFSFRHSNGRVVESTMSKDDSIWSRNMKRAIIEKFQLHLSAPPQTVYPDNLPPSPHVLPTEYKIYEDGISGLCKSIYDVYSARDIFSPHYAPVLNVTKTRDYHSCRHRPVFEQDNFDHKGCPWTCHSHSKHPLGPVSSISSEYSHSEFDQLTGACACGFEQYISPIKSYGVTKYNISLTEETPVIEGLVNEGKIELHVDGSVLTVLARTNITLARINPRSPIPPIPNPTKFKTLAYEINSPSYLSASESDPLYAGAFFGGMVSLPGDTGDHVKECVRLHHEIADRLSSDSSDGTVDIAALESYVLKLIRLMGILNINELTQVKTQVLMGTSPGGYEESNKKVMRKVFLDSVSMAGSRPSIVMVKKLIESNQVTPFEIKEMVEAIPKNVAFPTVETVNILRDLCLHNPKVKRSTIVFASTCLAFGKLVHKACVESHPPHPADKYPQDAGFHESLREKYDIYTSYMTGEDSANLGEHMRPYLRNTCTPSDAHAYVEEVKQRLISAIEFTEKTTFIETIAHIAHISGLRVLESYIKGIPRNCYLDTEVPEQPYPNCNFLRQVAVYSLHHMVGDYSKHILPLVTPIYFNRAEPYELRIAAFTVILFADAPMHVLERIATESWDEPNKEVGSFVYSSMQQLGNGTHPCVRSIAEKLKIVFPKVKDFGLGAMYSKLLFKDVYSESLLAGLQGFLSYTSNNVSVFPRSLYHSVTHNWASFFNMPLEVGANLKGVEEAIRIIKESLGELMSAFGDSSSWGGAIPEEFQDVIGGIPITPRTPEKFKATIFMKYFDRTSYIPLDKKTLHEVIQEIKQIINQIKMHKSYHYVKIMLPNSIVKMVPSELGLPVVQSSLNPLIVSVKINNAAIDLQSPIKVIRATIVPKIYYSSKVTGWALTHADNMIYGTVALRHQHTSVPTDIQIRFGTIRPGPKKTIELLVKPAMNRPVLHHRATPATFAQKYWLSSNNPGPFMKNVVTIHVLPRPYQFETRLTSALVGMGVKISGSTENYFDQLPLWKKGRTLRSAVLEVFEFILNPSWINRRITILTAQDPTSGSDELKLQLSVLRTLYQPFPEGQNTLRPPYEEDEHMTSDYGSYGSYKRPHGIPDIQSRIASVIKNMKNDFAGQSGAGYESPPGFESTQPVAFSDIEVILSGKSQNLPFIMHVVNVHTLDNTLTGTSLVSYHRSSSGTWIPPKFCAFMQTTSTSPPSDFVFLGSSSPIPPLTFIKAVIEPNCEGTTSSIEMQGIFAKDASVSSGLDESYAGTSTPWYETQCKVDSSMGKGVSFPCRLAIYRSSFYNKLILKLRYSEVSPAVRNVTEKIARMASHILYPSADLNTVQVQNPSNEIVVVAQFSRPTPEMKILDLLSFAPRQNLFLKKIATPYLYPLSSLTSTRSILLNEVADVDLITQCVVMENYLTTMDNVTIPYPRDGCSYLLSKDCSPKNRYEVSAKTVGGQSSKELTIKAKGHVIRLPPPTSRDRSTNFAVYTFTVDSQTYELTYGTAYIMKANYLFDYVYLLKTNLNSPIVIVKFESIGLLVKFDGTNALIQASPIYKGRHCGVCGDYNGNGYLEFLGPQECIYQQSEDFVKKYALQCQSHLQPRGPYYCPPSSPANSEFFQSNPHTWLKPGTHSHPVHPSNKFWSTKEESDLWAHSDSSDKAWSSSVESEKVWADPSSSGKPWMNPQHSDHPWNNPQAADHPWLKRQESDPLWSSKSASDPFWSSKSEPNPFFSSHEDSEPFHNQPSETQWSSEGSSGCKQFRTVYISRGDNVCFSMLPAFQCAPHCIETSSKSILMPFHCLPSGSSYAQELMKQADKETILLQWKTVDMRERISLPDDCRPA